PVVGTDTPFMPTDTDAAAGDYSATLTGSAVTQYAGIGFTLNDNCPYDASAVEGISFWAKGSGMVTFSIAVPGTIPAEEVGGSCVPDSAGDCHANFAAASITLTDEWEVHDIVWADLTQPSWGVPVAFDTAQISKFQWQI